MSEWQPIETAPKCELILVFDGKEISTARFVQVGPFEGNWIWTGCVQGEWTYRDEENWQIEPSPTYWMPLPEPPESE